MMKKSYKLWMISALTIGAISILLTIFDVSAYWVHWFRLISTLLVLPFFIYRWWRDREY
ncbi:hypothetical protein [Enterococcus alcedinis]|uniref:hypothetical protein n=1 Tax=Enterococcus alcedinis TaxID=1274384 RepID=UPI0016656559|nr:hypothetical protein [Enterococcus alcedinis]MBP2102548.1 preprotein translocase subunit Sec63 [Enterococcus alcedinis]